MTLMFSLCLSPKVKEKLVDAILQVSKPSNPENAVQIAGALAAVNAGGTTTISANAKVASHPFAVYIMTLGPRDVGLLRFSYFGSRID